MGLEALIAGYGEDECFKRALAFVREGGADGVMFHSKEKSPDEILSVLKRFRAEEPNVPVIVVPTSYNSITEDELKAALPTSASTPTTWCGLATSPCWTRPTRSSWRAGR